MLRYRLDIVPDDNGTLLVTSPDLPIVTFGKDETEALRNAADAIKVIIGSMMDARESVPRPDRPDEISALHCELSLQTELKVRLHQALLATNTSRADLAQRLNRNREAVDRLFRLDHDLSLDVLDEAFKTLGCVIDIDIREAA